MNQPLLTGDIAPDDCSREQLAALCWRLHRGRIEVLLITSRDTGRWVLPKGWPIKGLSNAESAAREAWEEAGVEGTVGDQPLGQFGYLKVLSPRKSVGCRVQVHPLRVARLRDRFPERKERRRHWFDAGKAAHLVAEDGLRKLLAALANSPETLTSTAATLDNGDNLTS